MKLKIVSDGTPRGTKVMTESGEVIDGVNNIFWQIGVEGLSCADITIGALPLTLTVPGNAEVDISKIVEAFKNVTVTDGQKRFTWKVDGVEGES